MSIGTPFGSEPGWLRIGAERRVPRPVHVALATIMLSTAPVMMPIVVRADQASPAAGASQPQDAAPASSQPAPAPAVPETKTAPGGTPATVIDGKQIESLLGKPVESSTGEDMGRIVDVLADKAGQARAAIIDFGGFFGVGSRKIAVDWRSLRFIAEGKADKVVVDLPKKQLKMAPVYSEGEPVVVLGPNAAGAAGSAPAAAATPSPATPPGSSSNP